MVKSIWLIVLLGIVPLGLGFPWIKHIISKRSLALAYSVGFFEGLALFHIICFPGIAFHLPFHVIAIVYSIVLSVMTLSGFLNYKKNSFKSKENIICAIRSLRWTEWIYLIAFITCVGIQLIRGITYDITYMSYDDASYTVYASDTLVKDIIPISDPYTGVGIVLNGRRITQTSLIYPAYLSWVSGISVATMEHTVQYVHYIILAYIVYIYMAGELFQKRENQLIFLVIVSFLYFFGYHSHYSLTFRLLGPNYQGKAVLAVSLTPLVLTLLRQVLSKPYSVKTGILLMILSTSAVSLTPWGIGTIIVIGTAPIILSLFRKERSWKHLIYILWVTGIPGVFLIYYLLYRIMI